MKDSDETLADFLGIELPAPDKPETLEAEVLDTENLAEIVVELSNVDLVKSKDALLNPANYRLNKDATVKHVHLDGDNVILTLIPYGKVEDQGNVASLVKGREYELTIRNIDNAINKTYKKIKAQDNTIPTVVDVDFMGTHGIKVTTNEPVYSPQERFFRLDSRTAMKVEQYGREIVLTPYHGRAFDKDAAELTVDELVDFAGYKSARTVEGMELSTDEALPKVIGAYRSGKELVVEFDRDVYYDSVKAYENRRELGNVSFTERRVEFYAEKAEKVDTNTVKYTFSREIPKGTDVVIEGVANHFNKVMEKETVEVKDFRDEYAPVIIEATEVVRILADEESKFDGLDTVEKVQDFLNSDENEFSTKEMEIIFDKDIAQIEDLSAAELTAKAADYFTLYELDITRRGRNAANDVKLHVAKVTDKSDRIKLTFQDIKVNNRDRDFDYILEVRNLSDLNGNRMDRDYLDFQVKRNTDDFKVTKITTNNARYFNRDGVEVVLEFNDYVNKEEASNARNYYLDGKLHVDEAIVERDGKTVSLVVYDTNKTKFESDYEVLEISPRVTKLNSSTVTVADRFFRLADGKVVNDPAADRNAANKAVNLVNKALEDDATTADKKAAVESYEELSSAQKELAKEAMSDIDSKVTGLKTDYEAEEAKASAEGKVEEVYNTIVKELPDSAIVKLEDKEDVENAREAFDKITSEEQGILGEEAKANYNTAKAKLEALESKIEELEDAADIEKLATAKENLEIEGDLDNVTEDLILPTTQDDATVTWESDTPATIANDGTVVRPDNGNGNATVELTATIKVGEQEDTKVFTVTVIEAQQ